MRYIHPSLVKILIFFFLFPFSFFLISCSDTGTEPPPKPPGYQEDIPWPSLADSPWPMHHGNPQSTGRSKYPGPMLGEIEWLIDSVYIRSGTSIGPDSTVYFINLKTPFSLMAVNPDGSIKWQNDSVITNSDVHTTPLITADNKIIIGGGLDKTLYALNLQGKVVWRYVADVQSIHVGLNIDRNGNIYFIDGNDMLNVVSENGELVTKVYIPGIVWGESAATAFSPDGSTLYVPGFGPTVFAVDVESFTIKWRFGQARLQGSPLVNTQGHIYVQSRVDSINDGKASLYCLNPDGSIRWSYIHNNPFFDEPASYLEGTIDEMGNYYFGFDTLYSVDFYGILNWKMDVNGYLESSLVCDSGDNIYFTISNALGGNIERIVSLNNMGSYIWQIITNPRQFPGYSPALGYNQTLYVPTYKATHFYKIK